jgi:hypothetical protein
MCNGVLGRKRMCQVSESQVCGEGLGSRSNRWKPEHQGGGWRGHAWSSWEPRSTVMWWRLPLIFQGADERFKWHTYTEAILHIHTVGIELNLSCHPDGVIHVSEFLERMVVWCSWLQCLKLILFSTTTDFYGCSRRICCWCFFNLVSVELPACPL